MFSDSEGMVSEYPSKGRLAKGWLSWKETMENAVRSQALKCREHRSQWKTDTHTHLKVIVAFPHVHGKIPALYNHNELNCLVVSACPSLRILLIGFHHRLILSVFPHKKLVWNRTPTTFKLTNIKLHHLASAEHRVHPRLANTCSFRNVTATLQHSLLKSLCLVWHVQTNHSVILLMCRRSYNSLFYLFFVGFFLVQKLYS